MRVLLHLAQSAQSRAYSMPDVCGVPYGNLYDVSVRHSNEEHDRLLRVSYRILAAMYVYEW